MSLDINNQILNLGYGQVPELQLCSESNPDTGMMILTWTAVLRIPGVRTSQVRRILVPGMFSRTEIY